MGKNTQSIPHPWCVSAQGRSLSASGGTSPSCPWPVPLTGQDIEKIVLGLPASATTNHLAQNHEPPTALRPKDVDAGGSFGDLAGLPRGNNVAQLKYMARCASRPCGMAVRERISQNEGFPRQNKRFASATTNHLAQNHEPPTALRPKDVDAGGFFGDLAGLLRGNNRGSFWRCRLADDPSQYFSTRGSFSKRQNRKNRGWFPRRQIPKETASPSPLPLHTPHLPTTHTTRRHPPPISPP